MKCKVAVVADATSRCPRFRAAFECGFNGDPEPAREDTLAFEGWQCGRIARLAVQSVQDTEILESQGGESC